MSKKVAILSNKKFSSSRFLAENFHESLKDFDICSKIIYNIYPLKRIYPISFWLNLKNRIINYKIRNKLLYLISDYFWLQKLRKYDLIVLSEPIPNAFWHDYLGIEYLKKKTNIPIVLLEVYYLGNAPSQIKKLKERSDPLFERYDYYLSVSDRTETKVPLSDSWTKIGLKLNSTSLFPQKKDLFAIIDFPQKGYEQERTIQVEVLKSLDIKYLELNKYYTFSEIRRLYQKASLLFIQSPEAFGLPIAECLACGSAVFTKETNWPMSWLLADNKQYLPDCFYVYHNKAKLYNMLQSFKKEYNPQETPVMISKIFKQHYPDFYFGNVDGIKKFIARFNL